MTRPKIDIEAFAPYPKREEDVTADVLARHLAAMAQARLELMWKRGNEPLFDALHSTSYVLEYGVVSLLRSFAAIDQDQADRAARAVWRAWDAGEMTGEHLWEWLEGYGIDPEQIIAASQPRPDTEGGVDGD